MRQELINKLLATYPTIFRHIGDDIAIGDGWFHIVDELCARLMRFPCEIAAIQVKEKFGGLRFYLAPIDDCPTAYLKDIFGYVRDAESASFNVCEYCGKPGKTSGRAWIKTLCEECNNAR